MRRRRSSRRPPTRPRSGDGGLRPGPDPRGGRSHLALAATGLALYFALLWLGVVVLGDTPLRSALFAGLIVAIAAAGYAFTRPPASPRQ